MKIPEYFMIKNSGGSVLAYLSPNDGVKGCYVDCRINGESTFTFSIPAECEKAQYITSECRIHAGGKVYYLLEDDAIETITDESDKTWMNVFAKELWYELDKIFVEPYISNDPNIPVPADLAVIIVGSGKDLSHGLYQVGSAAHALYAVLKETDWEVGTVDVEGIHDLEMEKVSVLQLIKQIRDIWGGYLLFDSEHKIVSLRDPLKWYSSSFFEIRYAKNLKHITKTIDNRIITRLYPFGKDNLDIAEVNNGVKYITNHTYSAKDYVGIYVDPNIEDANELKEIAEMYLSYVCRPRNLYKVKIVDIRVLPEYSHEKFSLGDMVRVYHSDVGIDEIVRIIQHRYNFFMPWECEMELGDPQERLIEKIKKATDSAAFVNKTFNSPGYLSGFKLEDLSVGDQKIVSLSADKITAGTIEALIKIIGPEIVGGVITGGVIRTAESGARIELSNDSLRTYNDQDELHGLVTNNDFFNNYGDPYIFDSGLKVFEIYNYLFWNGVCIRPTNDARMDFGHINSESKMYGNYTFDGNVGYPIKVLTRQQANAKSDWIPGQFVYITDDPKPEIGPYLPTNLSSVSASSLNQTNQRINEIIAALEYLGIIDRGE